MLILFRYSEILGILSNLIKYYSINSSNMEIIRYDLIIYVDINKIPYKIYPLLLRLVDPKFIFIKGTNFR